MASAYDFLKENGYIVFNLSAEGAYEILRFTADEIREMPASLFDTPYPDPYNIRALKAAAWKIDSLKGEVRKLKGE